MSRKLTDTLIASLRPKAKRYSVADKLLPSFYVRVTPTGAKSFVAVATDPAGKQKWTTIGPVSLYNVEQARDKARSIIRGVRDGEGAGAETFMTVAARYLKQHVEKNGLRSRADIERLIAKHLIPRWAGRDFASIKRSDIASMMDEVGAKHGERTADYALQVFRAISNWHAIRDDNYRSPVVKGMKRGKARETARERVLSDDDIRQVWAALEPGSTFGDLCKIALLTAQRREVVGAMKWESVSIDGVWSIPSERRAKGNIGAVKLPAMALDIIKARPRLASNPHVFAAARGKGAFSGYSKLKAKLDGLAPVDPWVLHDLRRTARSLMSRAGVAPHVAERVLGHELQGVERVYDRHAYLEEKAKALEALASLVASILNPSAKARSAKRRS